MEMTITDLFVVDLPGKDTPLDSRVEALHEAGMKMSIYARNFVPTQLSVSAVGRRELGVVVFDSGVTSEQAYAQVEEEGNVWRLAVIEDMLAAVWNPQCTKKLTPAIACIGSRFKSANKRSGIVTPYVALGNRLQEHALELAQQGVTWMSGIAFLVVKNQ